LAKTRGEEHWDKVNYRGPDHPVVRAFAEEKLRVFEQMLAKSGIGPLTPEERRKARVLDVGAGPGVFSAPLAREFENVTVVDVHETLIRRNPVLQRIQGDALNLPFRSDTFDVVFVGNVLHHLDDPAGCLRECGRVLKQKTGVLLSVEPNCLHPLMCLFGLLVKEERRLVRYTPGHMRKLAAAAGLNMIRSMVSGQIFQNTTREWMLPLVMPFERVNYPLGGYQHSVLQGK
jgi:2-polyprenyl-3-methyl-5-hydroxy-6-metoxy-1,4-benzoquinol methylase